MSGTEITARDARRVVDAALAKAESLGVAVSIAVVDNGGNLKEVSRMDGATFMTPTVAANKAMTAAGLGLSTKDFAEFAGTNPVLLTGMATQPDTAVFPGGVPITVDGQLAGAVGVAGGPAGEDHPIAETGAGAMAAVRAG
jgi:glc operon protein GlcG